jgi:hypothetical protein
MSLQQQHPKYLQQLPDLYNWPDVCVLISRLGWIAASDLQLAIRRPEIYVYLYIHI